ncbi:hypothetical protein GCM10027343_09160 [Noviherbaspirillum agri]
MLSYYDEPCGIFLTLATQCNLRTHPASNAVTDNDHGIACSASGPVQGRIGGRHAGGFGQHEIQGED